MTSAERSVPVDIVYPRNRARTLASAPVGHQSRLWQDGGDLRLMLVVGYVAIVQEMHPAFSSVSVQNSLFFSDVWRRWFERTLPPIMTSLFATEKQASIQARQIRNMHRTLEGVDEQGRTWKPLQVEVFHWAHATTIYSLKRMADLYGTPMSDVELEEYYADCLLWWNRYGVDDPENPFAPADWKSFEEWYHEFAQANCVRTEGVTTMLDFLASAPPPPIPVMMRAWWSRTTDDVYRNYVWMQTALLHPVLRERLGLPEWTAADEEKLQKIARAVKRAAKVTPKGIRSHPVARRAFLREDRNSPAQWVQYLAGEAVQRPVMALWRTMSTRTP